MKKIALSPKARIALFILAGIVLLSLFLIPYLFYANHWRYDRIKVYEIGSVELDHDFYTNISWDRYDMYAPNKSQDQILQYLTELEQDHNYADPKELSALYDTIKDMDPAANFVVSRGAPMKYIYYGYEDCGCFYINAAYGGESPKRLYIYRVNQTIPRAWG